jgi:hypothetical protein
MPLYQVERTERVLRVWVLEAASLDEALERYLEQEPQWQDTVSRYPEIQAHLIPPPVEVK